MILYSSILVEEKKEMFPHRMIFLLENIHNHKNLFEAHQDLLERILNFSNLSHCLNRISQRVCKLLNGLAVDSHEWINELFICDSWWYGWLPCRTLWINPLDSIENVFILRLNVIPKLQISLRIFMATEHFGIIRKCWKNWIE